MSYVLIYGGLRLDLDEGAMRELKLRPGQHVPNDLVAECVRAQARQVCNVLGGPEAPEELSGLSDWAFHGIERKPEAKTQSRAD